MKRLEMNPKNVYKINAQNYIARLLSPHIVWIENFAETDIWNVYQTEKLQMMNSISAKCIGYP